MECARAAQSSCRTYSHHDGVALSAGIIARTFCLGLLGSGRLQIVRERGNIGEARRSYTSLTVTRDCFTHIMANYNVRT